MSEDLIERALTELDGATLSEGACFLVMAALYGDDELASYLDGAFEPPHRTTPAEPTTPQRAYLSRITVRGFRGIGAFSTLTLPPGPGLTLVVGRNGSGKSSFAEAVEFLLTGTSLRWADRKSKDWEKGWRNLHESETTKIAADFAVDGRPKKTRLSAEWPPNGELADVSFSTRGEKGDDVVADLGWDEVVKSHRPLLSYPEIAKLAESGPSALYDSMSSILGLDELNVVAERLALLKKTRTADEQAVKAAKEGVLARLKASTDGRADRIGELLSARNPALDEINKAITASIADTSATNGVEGLRRLLSVEVQSEEVAATALSEFHDATAAVESLAGGSQDRSAQRLALLKAAVDFHSAHGDQECPVCHGGQLDNAWLTAAAVEMDSLAAEAEAVRQAKANLAVTTKRCEDILSALPTWIGDIDPTASDLVVDVARLITEARNCWVSGDAAKAFEHWGSLVAGLRIAQDDARAVVAASDDEWNPLVDAVRAWITTARALDAVPVTSRDVVGAAEWLKRIIDSIRTERFTPIADEVTGIWNQLRQSSNVSLDTLTLSGTNTSRRVNLEVSVDGESAAALSVMSQGELNSLALSLFLPRASLDDSPFGFMLIDDPVQAMDPSRIDGLALVLAEVAKTRQVVVFTHDDRLPEAIRSLKLEARVIEVIRGDQSEVKTKLLADPVTRILADARAIVRSDDVPDVLIERVVAGLCRQAAEAAAIESYRSKSLAKGVSHRSIEDSINAASTFVQFCALGLWEDSTKAGEVLKYFANKDNRVGDVAGALSRGAHTGRLPLDAAQLPNLTCDLCSALGWNGPINE